MCLEGFQARNPNLYVFNAVMHLDEATPHLHIDYIPLGHYSRGLEVRNAKNKALDEMGFGNDAHSNNRWRLREWEVLRDICNAHGIEISEPKKSRGYSYTVEEYGEHEDEIRRLNEEKAQVETELTDKQSECEKLDRQLEQKADQVKAILNYIPDYEKEFQIEDECEQLCEELTSLLNGKLSIMKHSDEIISKAQRLSKIMKKLSNSTHKSGDTVYALRERLDRSLKDTEDVRQRLKQTSGECSELRRDNSALQAQVDELTEFVSLLKRCEPLKYSEVRQMQENIHAQREQEVQQSAARKKKSWGLE